MSGEIVHEVKREVAEAVRGWFLPKYYGWFLLSLIGVFAMNVFQIAMVSKARRRYGIKYPNLYAPIGHKFEEKFNCIQRAHQNTLEFIPLTLTLGVVTSFFHPLLSASFLTIFAVSRVIYSIGYTKSIKNRRIGFIMSAFGGILPLAGLATYEGFNLIIRSILSD